MGSKVKRKTWASLTAVAAAALFQSTNAAPQYHRYDHSIEAAASVNVDLLNFDTSPDHLDTSLVPALSPPLDADYPGSDAPGVGFNLENLDRWEDRDLDEDSTNNLDAELERWYNSWQLAPDDEAAELYPYPSHSSSSSHSVSSILDPFYHHEEDPDDPFRHTVEQGNLVPHRYSDSSPSSTSPKPPSTSSPGAPVSTSSAANDKGDTKSDKKGTANHPVEAPTIAPHVLRKLDHLHATHVSEFAELNTKFESQVQAMRKRHAEGISKIINQDVHGKKDGIDVSKLDGRQMAQLAFYGRYIEHEVRRLYLRQMDKRVQLLRIQQREMKRLRKKNGLTEEVVGGSKYMGGLSEEDVYWFGYWLEEEAPEKEQK
ncbi:hypothetical protein QBC35DRAFT_447391 [Podospora australis]|uniref:Uncharacterized protein n=1 Tax=Podospora australis TaxID=1536484 RepID=A0AAN7ANF2_9PEZI|nr:hypothetical protein QBC35DRAFT_447391 [Podospora australis]